VTDNFVERAFFIKKHNKREIKFKMKRKLYLSHFRKSYIWLNIQRFVGIEILDTTYLFSKNYYSFAFKSKFYFVVKRATPRSGHVTYRKYFFVNIYFLVTTGLVLNYIVYRFGNLFKTNYWSVDLGKALQRFSLIILISKWNIYFETKNHNRLYKAHSF